MTASGLLALGALLFGSGGPVVPSPSPPATAVSSAPEPCLAQMVFLAALDADPSGSSRSYAISLAPAGGDAGKASGIVSVYDAAHRWDIPFHGIIAANPGGNPAPTPIVVRFGSPVKLEVGHLASLAGPDRGLCRAQSVEAEHYTPTKPQPPITAIQSLITSAESAVPIDAPSPVPDPQPTCSVPNAAPHTLHGVPPATPAIALIEELRGRVVVRVLLADDGGVLSTSNYSSSGSSILDDLALKAAAASTYVSAVRNCRSVSDVYLFRANFDSGR